jgi:chromosome segregation ATPase
LTRGKYARRHQHQRDAAELAERADKAEQERDTLAAELAELREASGVKIAALKAHATSLRKQRDDGDTVAVATLTLQNRRLRRDLTAVTAERDEFLADIRKLVRRLEVLLCEASVCSNILEAQELLCGLTQASSLRGLLPATNATATERTPR